MTHRMALQRAIAFMQLTFNPAMRGPHRRTWGRYLVLGMLASILFAALAAAWFTFSWFYPWALRNTLSAHQGGVNCVAFAPDGQTLATGGEDWAVRLWSFPSGKAQAILTGHTGEVVAV